MKDEFSKSFTWTNNEHSVETGSGHSYIRSDGTNLMEESKWHLSRRTELPIAHQMTSAHANRNGTMKFSGKPEELEQFCRNRLAVLSHNNWDGVIGAKSDDRIL